jgi:hypothetical protein
MNPSSRRGRPSRGGRPSGRLPARPAKRRDDGRVDRSADVVRRTLASYATRGVFRAYGDQSSEGGQSRFSFRWHADAIFHLVYHARRRELVFSNLLPEIPSRTSMYRELRAFVEASTSRALPEHRRIDPRKVGVTVTNRNRTVSLVVMLKDSHVEYGVRKAVNLIHELFVGFLRNPLYFPYMVEHFQRDPDV